MGVSPRQVQMPDFGGTPAGGVNILDLCGMCKHLYEKMHYYSNICRIFALAACSALFAACASEKMDRSQLTAIEEDAPSAQQAPAKEADEAKPEDAEPKEEADGDIMGLTYKGETEISYCFNDYLTDAETRSIVEIFTGEEFTQGYLTLRTQPDKRAGRYFSLMISGPDEIPLGTTITLEVDSSRRTGTSKYTFTVPETHGLLREIRLGVTGSDWPDEDELVNAWKITIKNPYGLPVVTKESWLWSIKGKEISREELQEDLQRRKHIAEREAAKALEEEQAKAGGLEAADAANSASDRQEGVSDGKSAEPSSQKKSEE